MSHLPSQNEPNPTDANTEHGPERVIAASELIASEAFGRWLDTELTKLEARWVHLAAPNASKPRRTFLRNRSGK